jgi:hypothetical protein
MFWSIIGLAAFTFSLYLFLKKLGESLPILELILTIAGLQWIVGPFIEYRTAFEHYKYHMYVNEPTYMSFVVPAYITFLVVLFLVTRNSKMNNLDTSDYDQYGKLGLQLVFFGLIIDVISPFLPPSLNFLYFLLSNFKYVGAIIIYFSTNPWLKYLFYLAVAYLFLNALTTGMFHGFILWSIFFYMFWALKNKPKLRFNITVFVLGFFLSTIIQVVKADYRAIVWSGGSGGNVSLFVDILNKRISGGFTENVEEQQGLNVRLNQGWIISAVIDHVPNNEPFADGETVKEAVTATLLPRFLNPNKKEATGRSNFIKYTGIELGPNTSMALSIMGEAYANFGYLLGIVFMGIYGFLVSKYWNWLGVQLERNVLLTFFLPIIFLQVVKAESELLTVLNHLFKSSILVFLFLTIRRSFIRT